MTDAISGPINFRDVGGLPAGDAVTRSGVLYRSGNLARLDEAAVDVVRAVGLRRIVDLRSDEELGHSPSPEEFAAIVQRVPLFLGSVASFFQEDLSLDDMYRAVVEESADRVVEVVRAVVADQPVLVHCTVGKDRTGVTVALTLAAAGVDLDAVVDDYARTEGLLPESRNRAVVERIRALHPEAVHLEDLATRSPAPVMRALLDGLIERYGSVAGYLRAHGVAEDELIALREVLITER